MWPTALQAAADPLWERIVVAATGPGVTVLVGGLAVWAITSRIAADREDAVRRRAEAREDAEALREQHARDDALRHELVDAMTSSAGSLYLMTQHYWRAKEDAAGQDPLLVGKLEALRPRLDEQYLASRATGEAVENRLWGYFATTAPRDAWHAVQDLLTVRYFQLTDRDTDKLYEANAGPAHSGLSPAELRRPLTLLATYREALKTAVGLVFSEPLRSRSGPHPPTPTSPAPGA